MSLAEAAAVASPALDVERIRQDFPILGRRIREHPLVYLDNAATTQKPRQVLDALARYYDSGNANIHRGVYTLSEEATAAYDAARVKVQRFINARASREIIFTRNSTESINLVAQSFGRRQVGPGDEVLITHMEHHSNIVPWQLLCEQVGAQLRVAPIDDSGTLQLDELERLIGPRTKLVSVVHLSNSLGTINPVREIVEMAKRRDVPVLIDGSQSVYHMPVDVQALDCDFYAFTGHKLYGPTGIGVLYGREAWLERMPPYQGGGDMIRSVTFEKTTYADLPHKFEAGTPHIAGVVGLGAAIDYLQSVGLEAIAPHEADLLSYGDGRAVGGGGAAADRHGGAQGEHPRLRHEEGAPARRRAPSSTPKGWPSAPATTARSRSWTVSACRRRRAPRWRCTTRARRSTRWCARSSACGRCSPMSDLRELYQEVILDHNRRPHNFGELDGADRHADGYNPLCGDRLAVYVNLDGDTISEVSFLGSGCAISKASASLMTDAVKGKTLGEARRLFEQFLALVTDDAAVVDDRLVGKLARLRRRARLPDPRQVRQPRLAYAAGRGRGSPRARVDGVGEAGRRTASVGRLSRLDDGQSVEVATVEPPVTGDQTAGLYPSMGADQEVGDDSFPAAAGGTISPPHPSGQKQRSTVRRLAANPCIRKEGVQVFRSLEAGRQLRVHRIAHDERACRRAGLDHRERSVDEVRIGAQHVQQDAGVDRRNHRPRKSSMNSSTDSGIRPIRPIHRRMPSSTAGARFLRMTSSPPDSRKAISS